MISDVAKGIITKYTGSALASVLTGGMWQGVAKQDVSSPYCVFIIVDAQNQQTYSKAMEFHRVQFTIWTTDINPATASTGLNALETALRTLYDGAVLTVTGWTNLGMIYDTSRPAYSEDGRVIGVIIEYYTWITK